MLIRKRKQTGADIACPAGGSGGGCWPAREQECLLRAALLEGEEAVEAWRTWSSWVDIDRIDHGSQRMLPLLYRNLLQHGLRDPLMNTFKGVHRRTWYEHQVLVRTISVLLRLFQEAGIRTMILKGMALSLRHYPDRGLRPMDDFDLLVPTEQAMAAIRILSGQGWLPTLRPITAFSPSLFMVRHSEMFRDGSGHAFDLHWHLLHECCYDHADDPFWDGARPIDVGGVSSETLNPTDQLFHTCIHGVMWNVIPPLRWIADAAMILRTAGAEIDWGRLVALARERCLVLRLREALTYIQDLLSLAVPPSVLKDLLETPVSRIERKEHISKCRPSRLGQLPAYWYHYRALSRRRRQAKLRPRSVSFLRYLQMAWGLDHPWHVPAQICQKVLLRGKDLVAGPHG